MEVAVFSFGEASCLVVVQTFTSSTQVQSTGPVIVTRFFFHMCVFLEAPMRSAVPFHGRQCTMSSHSSCRTALRKQTLGSSYLTTSNDSGASIGASRRMGSNASTNSLTPSFSAWADAVKPALAVRGDHIPY
ncbi:hypothetical protein TNCV_1900821 [Trichonephila clavipes]|nr:hypothetical protein TNCV_1900821 [Trichonephila clavipes]